MAEPKVIKIEKAEREPFDEEEFVILVCLFYPQYTLKQAEALPFKRIKKMLKIARQEQAVKYHTLTQIVAAPHTKNGQGVKKLMDHFKNIIQNG